MTPGVEPVFASGAAAWPLAGLPDGFAPGDPDLEFPNDGIRSGLNHETELHFPVSPDNRVTHTATEPLAPAKFPQAGRKWNLSIFASCVFHAAIAGVFLYAVDDSVLMEGADFSGVAYLGAGEDQLKAGEISDIDAETVDITMVTMLQAKPVETVEAEAVPVTDAAEPVEMAEAVAAEPERLQPVAPLKAEKAAADAQRHVDADSTAAEPIETQPASPVTQTVPEVLATDRVELVENDNVTQKPAQVQAAETTQIPPVETVQVELTESLKAAVSETSKVETTEIAQAEQNETENVEAPTVETPNVAPQPEPKPKQIADAEPAKRKSATQGQPREASRKKAAEEKPQAKPNRSGNGGQNNANSRRGQADGQEKGDSRQASRGGSKSGMVGNAATSNYPGKVRSKLARIARSVRARGKGEVVVAFAVGANGAVHSARVARSSGVATVDQAALQAVRKASPFPPIPKNAGRSSWEFSVPLAFLR